MVDTYVVSESGKATILKDPNATLDYPFNWTAWLDDVSDALATKTVTTPTLDSEGQATTLVVVDSNIVGKKVVAIISGGTPGKTYPVTCHVVTAATPPREDDRTIYIKIKER